jgi:hypothetical protein
VDPGVTIQPPLTLRGYCEAFISKHSGTWPPSEHTLAQEFVTFFEIHAFLKLEDLEKRCEMLGVNVSVRDLPKGLRGHNCAYQGNREIVIGRVEGPAATMGIPEHTLFHELRELIEYEFQKMGRPIATASDLESRAETFAGAVRAMGYVNAWKPMIEGIPDIKSGWVRFGAFALVSVLVVVVSFSCLLLPRWEDRLPS